jgi:hypothetical protein
MAAQQPSPQQATPECRYSARTVPLQSPVCPRPSDRDDGRVQVAEAASGDRRGAPPGGAVLHSTAPVPPSTAQPILPHKSVFRMCVRACVHWTGYQKIKMPLLELEHRARSAHDL